MDLPAVVEDPKVDNEKKDPTSGLNLYHHAIVEKSAALWEFKDATPGKSNRGKIHKRLVKALRESR